MSLVAHRSHAIFSILALFVLSAAAAFGDCGALVGSTTSFNLPGPLGDWGTAAEWSTLSVPNSSTSACIINGTALTPTTVTLAAGQTGNVLSLEVDAHNTLTLANNSQLNVYGTQIINGGAINIAAGANDTILALDTNSTLSGAGTLTLSTTGGGTAIIDQLVGGVTLTNQSTIAGTGIIGNNNLALTNSGTVNANSSGNVLTLNGGTITNTGGTLEATGGGILNIITTGVTNGNITATGAGSTVNIDSGGAGNVITGATLTNTGGGVLQTLATEYASFNNLTLTTGSTFTNGNDAYMYLNGTTTNQGTINIASGVNSSILWLTGNTTLTGGGTVTLSGAAGAFIDQTVGGLTLTNTNNLIKATGTAFIGNNNVTLINQATVDADGAAANLTLQGPQTTNTGATLEATNSGTLNIANSVNGGLILANGGTVNIDGSGNSFPILNATLTSENGGTLQTINGGYADFDGVTLTAGSTYTNGNNAYLYFNNTITNNGTINIAAGVNDSILWMNNNVTLTGTGTLELSTTGAGGTALIEQTVGGLTLTNQETIAGAGIIGVNNLAVVNQGTINANTSGQTLSLQGVGGYTNNGGLITASNGGTLQISGATVNNSGGQITTTTGGTGELIGSGTIQGGTLSGNFVTDLTQNFTLDGSAHGALTLATGSTYNVNNDSFLFLTGSIVNNGTINLNAGANNTDIFLTNNTTLSGTGTLNLTTSGAGAAEINQLVGGLTLTNQETIAGAGIIGSNNLSVTNQGTINANTPSQTLFLEGAGAYTNNGGIIEATNNGILQIDGATVNNFNGTIQTNSGGIVQLMGQGTVVGGILSGNFETINTDNFILDGSTSGSLVFEPGSTYNVDNDSFLFVKGSIINHGAINLNAGANNTDLILQANTTLSGSGALTLGTSGAGVALIEQQVGGLTLTNQSTIQGTGQIGVNNLAILNDTTGLLLARTGDSLTINTGGGLTNNGTMQVNPGGTMTVTTPLTNFGGGVLTGGTYIINGATGNTGTMSISLGANTGGEITTNAASITLNGPIANTKFVDSNGNNLLSALNTNSGSLTLEGGYGFTTSAATLTNSGTVTVGTAAGDGTKLTVNGGGAGTAYAQTGGTTQGTGTIIAANSNINGGTLLPGASTANPGTLSFTGNLGIGASGSLSEGITGTTLGDYGVTNVTGALNINGSAALNITNAAGLVVPIGTQLTIMTSSNMPVGSGFTGVASGATFNAGVETWTVGKVGNDEVLNATLTPGDVITATWSGPSGNWTTTAGTAPSLTSNWTCNVPIVNFSGNDCVPVNNAPATAVYAAVLNSAGHTMTLAASDNPNNPVVNTVTVQAGTLDVQAGANLQLTVANNGGFNQTGGTTTVDGTLSTFAGGANLTGDSLFQGTGSVGGNVTVGADVALLPGDSVFSPGTLTFSNNLTLGGYIDEVLNGSTAGQFGVLSVGQGFTLNAGSVLDIMQSGSYNPLAGSAPLTIATGTITGTFSSIQNDTFNGGTEFWKVLYNGNNIQLQAESEVTSGVFTATWSTASNNWTNASAWTCVPALTPCVPNNGTPAGDTYAAVLNSSGNTLTLDNTSSPSSVTVNSVDLEAGMLQIGPGGGATGGSLTVTGDFTDAAPNTGAETYGIKMQGGTLTVGGSLDIVNTLDGGSELFGYGTVNGTGSLTNNGAIYGGQYTLDLSGINVTNLVGGTLTGGVWQAGVANPGFLKLPGDIVTNSAVNIVLQNAGSEILDGSGNNALSNTLTSNNGGALTLFSGATLALNNNFTNGNGSGINISFGGSALTVNGNLTNSGGSTINVNGTGGGASLTVNGNLSNLDTSTITLSNSGMLTVSNPAGPAITNNSTISDGGAISLTDSGNGKTGTLGGTGTLTLQGGSVTFASDMGFVSTSTINGNGTIGGGTEGITNFDNRGTLMPTTGTITLNSDFNNDGTVTVNTGNTLLIDAGSHIGNSTFQNATITINGGTLTDNSANPVGNGLANGFTGTLTVEGGGKGTIGGELFNGPFGGATGVVTVTGAGSSLTLTGGLDNGACLSGCGTGTVNVLAGGLLTSGNSVFIANDAGSTGTLLINGAGSELNTTGNNVIIGTGGTLTVSAGGTLLTDNGSITTSGAVTVGNGGTVSMGTGDYTQDAGTTTIDAGGIIDPNNFMVNGGTAQVDGSLTATTVSVANGAELTGNGGTITGNLINDGTLSPGTGAAPGTLTVNGNINLAGVTGANDGTFLELISGLNNFGVLDDNGTGTLGGTLDVSLLGGYHPVVGNTFTFLDPFGYSGTFTTLDLPNAAGGDEYLVQYNPANVELCFVSAANPTCGAPANTQPGSVPEPKSVVLLGTVILAALWYHRKRAANG